jgi:hypothetical protein
LPAGQYYRSFYGYFLLCHGDKDVKSCLERYKNYDFTEEDFKKCNEIHERQKGLGIDPEADLTADEKFRKDIDGYITVCEIAEKSTLMMTAT